MALFRSIGAALDDDGTGTEPIDTRKGLAALFRGVGVLPGYTPPLVQGTDAFEYQVNAAHWVTSRGGSDGMHLWGNDGPITVPTDVAPGAGLSRIDVIYALHPSNGENADTTSEPLIGVAKGTAAAVPIAPSIPTGALALARNTMSSSATDTAGAGNTIEQVVGFAPMLTAAPGSAANVTAASGFSSSARARTMGMFDVALEGSITGTLTHATQVGTVPSGLGPAVDGYYAAACSGQSSSLAQTVRVRVTPGGGVYVYGPPAGATEVHLDSIRYRRPHTP